MTPKERARKELEGAFSTRGEAIGDTPTLSLGDAVLVVADEAWLKGRAFATCARLGLPNFRAHLHLNDEPFAPGCPADLLAAVDKPWASIGDIRFGIVDDVFYLLAIGYRRREIDRVQRYLQKAHADVAEWLRAAPRPWITTSYLPTPLNIAVEEQLSWLAPVVGRQGDALVARFSFRDFEGQSRWSDQGTHFAATLPLKDKKATLVPEETGLKGAWKRRGEAHLGVEPLDSDWVIDAEPAAFEMLRERSGDLDQLRPYGAHVKFLPYELIVEVRGTWLIDLPALLWRKVILSRLGARL